MKGKTNSTPAACYGFDCRGRHSSSTIHIPHTDIRGSIVESASKTSVQSCSVRKVTPGLSCAEKLLA